MCMRTLCPRASPSARVPEPRRGAGRWMMRPARCLALPEGVTLKRPGRWRSRTGAVVMAVQGGRHHPLPGLSGRERAGGREAEPDPLLHPPEGHARGKGEVWGERGRIGDWRLDRIRSSNHRVRFCRIGFSSESKPLRKAEFIAVFDRAFSPDGRKTVFAGHHP